MKPTIKSNYQTTFHDDGSVSFWSVYQQLWMRLKASQVSDHDLALMSDHDREWVLDMSGTQGDGTESVPPANHMSHWNTTEPPKDGTVIVAVGRVIVDDGLVVEADPFVAAVRWVKNQSGYDGWHYARDGMTVARALDDEIVIDWWAEYPKEQAS